MALFKIAKDSMGERIRYKTEHELRNLLDYMLRKSTYTDVAYMIPGDATVLANQFLYIQNCKGRELTTRALHFILAFDSYGWEWEMDLQKTQDCIRVLYLLRSQFGLEEYQIIFAVHDNGHTRHIHIAINPVHTGNKKILHYNLSEFHLFQKELARHLYMIYGLELMGVSYVDTNGRLKWGHNEFLYENRQYPYEMIRKNRKH